MKMKLYTSDVYRHFLGSKKLSYYLARFQTIYLHSPLLPGWNWGAFLFGGFWMVYRKFGGLLLLYMIFLSMLIKVIFPIYGATGFLIAYILISKVLFPMYVDLYVFWRIAQKIEKSEKAERGAFDEENKNVFAPITEASLNNPRI